MLMKMSNWLWMSLFTILYTCFFLKVTVKAVIKFDNKLLFASPSTASSISGRRLDCQPHHFFHRVVCREHFTLFDRMADHAV